MPGDSPRTLHTSRVEPYAGPVTPHSPSHYAAAGEGLARQRKPALPSRLPGRTETDPSTPAVHTAGERTKTQTRAPRPAPAHPVGSCNDGRGHQPTAAWAGRMRTQDRALDSGLRLSGARGGDAHAGAAPPRLPGPPEAQIAPPGLAALFPGVPPLPALRGGLARPGGFVGTGRVSVLPSGVTPPRPHTAREPLAWVFVQKPLWELQADRTEHINLRMTLLGLPSVVSRGFAGKPPPVSLKKRLRKARGLGP